MEEKLPFLIEKYNQVVTTWPISGNHIIGTHTDSSIVLYQAYKPSIASFATQQETFVGCPEYNDKRMTWLKPNFLWMMYRSGWATKPNQEHILAITISIDGFHQILKKASLKDKESDVRLQWDPDHDPFGEKVTRRAIQLGIRNETLQMFMKNWILRIDDITEFVIKQREHVFANSIENLYVPFERVYDPKDEDIVKCIGLS